MVQGTLAYCLPRQISFGVPISSVRGGIGRPLFLVSSLAEKSPAAHSCAVAGHRRELGRVLTASRPDATNWPDARTPAAQPMREWLPWIDFGVMHHGFAPRGHNYALILQAAGLARSPHSCRGVAIRNTDTWWGPVSFCTVQEWCMTARTGSATTFCSIVRHVFATLLPKRDSWESAVW